MKLQTKFISAALVFSAMTAYRKVCPMFNLPTILSDQWYVLSAMITFFLFIGSFFLNGYVINLLCKEYNYQIKEKYKNIYDHAGDKLYSVGWQISFFVLSAVMFQFAYFTHAVFYFVFGVTLLLFRKLHEKILNKVKVEVL